MNNIVIGGAIGYQKPLLEPFKLWAKKSGVDCSEVLYVGDAPYNDAEENYFIGYLR